MIDGGHWFIVGKLCAKHATADFYTAVAAEVLGCCLEEVRPDQRRHVKETLYVWMYSVDPGPLPLDLVSVEMPR